MKINVKSPIWPCLIPTNHNHHHLKTLLAKEKSSQNSSRPPLPLLYLNVHDLEALGLSSVTSKESARCLHVSFPPTALSSLVLAPSSFLSGRQFWQRPGRRRWSSLWVPHSAWRASARPQKPIRRSFWLRGQMQPQEVYF